MAGKSLGPFPKTLRWRQLGSEADIARLRREYERLANDEQAIKVVLFWVGLVISARCEGDERMPDLPQMLDSLIPLPHPAKEALRRTFREVQDQDETLFDLDPWAPWRRYDGVAFCDLARRFYANLNLVFFAKYLGESEEARRLAQEMALITRSFSARWFNACAKDKTPEAGSIRWYFAHCMGKLDLELARETSDWDEKSARLGRKKPTAPRLPLEESP